ncbi:MAG TPA: hypothetical protein P5560_05965 [Thermotogota bacterium]|nr:hypothetical protein [Thermotogota bacterium]HRW92484.1 hypothetical protein [Thermotogota bacterium]
MSNDMRSGSFSLAIAGVSSALCLVFVLLANLVPFNRLFFLGISAVILAFILDVYPKKTGVMVFLATSILAMLLPLKSMAILFTTSFGGYVVFRSLVQNLARPWQWLLKFTYLNGCLALYVWGLELFFSELLQPFLDRPFWHILGFFFVFQVAIFLYDVLLELSGKKLHEWMQRFEEK